MLYYPAPFIIDLNENTRLKHLELSDAQSLFLLIEQERAYLSPWLPFIEDILTLNDTHTYIKVLLTPQGGNYNPAYLLQKDQHNIGFIGCKDTDYINHKTELGYWIAQREQKQGLITQSVIKLCHWAFTQAGFHRIEIKSSVKNISSLKIPKRLSFHFEGTLRAAECLSDNTYNDLYLYSLLKTEFIQEKYNLFTYNNL